MVEEPFQVLALKQQDPDPCFLQRLVSGDTGVIPSKLPHDSPSQVSFPEERRVRKNLTGGAASRGARLLKSCALPSSLPSTATAGDQPATDLGSEPLPKATAKHS